jgi:hypothetical protein
VDNGKVFLVSGTIGFNSINFGGNAGREILEVGRLDWPGVVGTEIDFADRIRIISLREKVP